MQIAELFINLGVKGTEKTVGAFTGMQKGLGETKSMALETKVALVALMYSLEQLFAKSGQRGTELSNFSLMMDTTTKTLQQYQYAARQAGASNEEVEGTFKSLSSSMTKILMGEGVPKYWAQISKAANIADKDIADFAKNPELLIQKLQVAAAKLPKSLRHEAFSSLGLNDSMQAAIDRQVFTPKNLNQAPIYSDQEVTQLDKNRASWANLRNEIEMAVGHFNSKHGQQLVKGITDITEKVMKLVEAFTIFAEKMKLFEKIGKVFEGWAIIFDTLGTTMDEINGKEVDHSKKMDVMDLMGLRNEKGETKGAGEAAGDFINMLGKAVGGGNPSPLSPLNAPERTATPPVTPAPTNNNVNVNQNLHFHGNDGKDMGKVSQIHKDSFKEAVKHTYRSNPAQAGGI